MILYSLLKVLVFTLLPIGAMNPAAPDVDRFQGTPNFIQTDQDSSLPGGGKEFCGPVAASNSLVWLSKNGFPNLAPNSGSPKDDQVSMIKTLGSNEYMRTNLIDGTGVNNFLNGVGKYVRSCNYQFASLQYEGWRKGSQNYPTIADKPSLRDIRLSLEGKSGIWINIGWYKFDAAQNLYKRTGGHWVTVVGAGVNSSGQNSPNTLIIHDSSFRTCPDRLPEFLQLEELVDGQMAGKNDNVQRSARGYYRVASGMKFSKKVTPIIDGVVILKM